jgi:hypothetical protein
MERWLPSPSRMYVDWGEICCDLKVIRELPASSPNAAAGAAAVPALAAQAKDESVSRHLIINYHLGCLTNIIRKVVPSLS